MLSETRSADETRPAPGPSRRKTLVETPVDWSVQRRRGPDKSDRPGLRGAPVTPPSNKILIQGRLVPRAAASPPASPWSSNGDQSRLQILCCM
ncbi:hypothetical protein NHX12_025416 [Muraenolepis orangiensis]|uniref:Uncharacterized protein n=1 Tax=Muraenolepis orangiensis TaxID=630683 RepID=A0A9Q0IS92_9TELE|nr:hypothetical protein NHX12_025416 [Muraenolepis orangiensis]